MQQKIGYSDPCPLGRTWTLRPLGERRIISFVPACKYLCTTLAMMCTFFVLSSSWTSQGVRGQPPFPSHRFPPMQTFFLRLSSMCYHQFPPLVWFRQCKRVSPSSFLCTRSFVPFVLFGRASTHLWTAAAAPARAAEDHHEQVVQGFAHSSHALAREANIASAFAIAFSHRDTCRFEEKRTSSSPSHLVRFVNFRLTGRT